MFYNFLCAPPQNRLATVLPINFHFGIFTSSTADAKNLHADLLKRLKFAVDRNNSESHSCFNYLVVDRTTERSKGDYFRWLKFEIQIRCFCKRKRESSLQISEQKQQREKEKIEFHEWKNKSDEILIFKKKRKNA